MDLPELDAAEQRVLGSLLEKEVTVPTTYPMSINAVRTACNQTSSREPVVDYDDRFVHDTLRELKARELVAVTWEDKGRRTMKYLQRLSVVLDLGVEERALLTVLLLRGAQAPGALKTRTDRLHGFADRGEVEEVLTRMAAAETPLVRELDKQPGERDHRWIHLLGPVELPEGRTPSVEAAPAVDRESVLAAGGEARDEQVRTSYDSVATAYADHLADELAHLPFERWLLDRAAALAGSDPVVEVGCGPGHVTAHLASAGARAVGLDLSEGMVAEARRRFPDGDYRVGDLRRLMRPDDAEGWGAVLAWYSLCHSAASELPGLVEGLARPLRPGGWLVVALHAGAETMHRDDWFERPIDLRFVLHDPAEVRAAVESAGLVDVEWYVRGPNTAREETTERCYVLGRRPG